MWVYWPLFTELWDEDLVAAGVLVDGEVDAFNFDYIQVNGFGFGPSWGVEPIVGFILLFLSSVCDSSV